LEAFLLPIWPKLKENIDGLGNAPLKTVIDTLWPVNRTDNNANLHAAGATVLTARFWVCTFWHPPADALPQQNFSSSKELRANGEIVMLQYFQPAHTDTDIYIHFQKDNVIHMGDTLTASTRSSTPAPAEKSTE
jgi:cyclase